MSNEYEKQEQVFNTDIKFPDIPYTDESESVEDNTYIPSYDASESDSEASKPNPDDSFGSNEQYEPEPQEDTEEPSGITPEEIASMSEEEIANLSTEEFLNKISKEEAESSNESNQETDKSETMDSPEVKTSAEEMSDTEFRKFLTSSFRANNTDVQVENPEDIRRLMQMGMNYQKKVGKIRPHLRAVKSLEAAGLLDETKINQLIDIAQHKPEAISALLKEANIDTYDLPDLEEKPYKPSQHMLSEEQYTLSEVIEELQEIPEGIKALEYVKTWDDTSKQEVFDNPEILKQLASQVESGVYQQAISIIERDRALGKIPNNMSAIDAYDIAATHVMSINKRNTPKKQKVVGSNRKQDYQSTSNRNSKPNASIPKSTGTPNTQVLIEPIEIANMSEEELNQFGTFDEYVKHLQFKK